MLPDPCAHLLCTPWMLVQAAVLPCGDSSASATPGSSFRSMALEGGPGVPGVCTLEGSIVMEQLLSLYATSACIGLVASAQRLMQQCYPDAAPHHTGWPILWALLAGVNVVVAQCLGGWLLGRYTHWEVPMDKAASLGASLCQPLSAFVDLAVALRWDAWAILFVPLLTVLFMAGASWGVLRGLRDHLPFWQLLCSPACCRSSAWRARSR